MSSLCTMNPFGRSIDVIYLTYISLRIVHSLCGYPRFTKQELNAEFYGPRNNEKEIKFINEFSLNIKPINIVYTTFCICVVSIGCVFPVYTIISMNLFQSQYSDLKNTGGDVKPSATTKTVTSFGCLMTNCSKLSIGNSFEDEMVSLPVFRLCFPTLQAYYFPILDISLFGLIIQTVSNFVIFVFGVVMPINLYTNPLSHEADVFVFTPDTVHRLHGEIARKYLIDVLTSMRCFYQTWKKNLPLIVMDEQSTAVISKPGQLSRRLFGSLISNQIHDEESYLKAENSQLQRIRQDYSLLHKNLRNYIDDCVPFIRTRYFISMMNKQYWSILISCFLYICALAVLVVIVTHNATIERERELLQIDRFIESTGCAIWRSIDDSHIDYIRLGESKSRWTLFNLLYYATLVLPVMIIIGSLVGISLMSLQELNIEITAQSDRMQLALEMTRLMLEISDIDDCSHEVDSKLRSSNNDINYGVNECDLNKLRLLHHRQLYYYGLVFLEPLKGQKHGIEFTQKSGTNQLRDLAYNQLVEHGTNEDVYLSALIKIYISSRLLTRLVRKNSKNLTRILAYCYSVTIGIVLIVVYYNTKFSAKNYASIALTIFALFVTITVIATASSVQANSKHLLELIWQLLAATNQFRDTRIRHMRLLWLRHIIVLRFERGMTLRAFNIPITYERVIQILLWSSSLIILAFSR